MKQLLRVLGTFGKTSYKVGYNIGKDALQDEVKNQVNGNDGKITKAAKAAGLFQAQKPTTNRNLSNATSTVAEPPSETKVNDIQDIIDHHLRKTSSSHNQHNQINNLL